MQLCHATRQASCRPERAHYLEEGHRLKASRRPVWWAETGLHTWKSPRFSTSSISDLAIPVLCLQKACAKHGDQHVTDLRGVQLQRLDKLRLS